MLKIFAFWFLLLFCLPQYGHFIELIMRISLNLFADYSEFADVRTKGKSRFLYYNGYRFYRKWTLGKYTYWMCSKYSSTRCGAKITTRTIGGYEKLKVSKATHTCTWILNSFLALIEQVSKNPNAFFYSLKNKSFLIKLSKF